MRLSWYAADQNGNININGSELKAYAVKSGWTPMFIDILFEYGIITSRTMMNVTIRSESLKGYKLNCSKLYGKGELRALFNEYS